MQSAHHFHTKISLLIQHFRGPVSPAEDFREIGRFEPELIHSEFDCLDGIRGRDRVSPLLVCLHQCNQNVEPVSRCRTRFRTPEFVDFLESFCRSRSVLIGLIVTSNLLCIDSVVGRVCPDKPDIHDLKVVLDSHDEAVTIAHDIEYDPIVSNKASRPVGVLNILRGSPIGPSSFCIPRSECALCVRMPFPKSFERLYRDYSHWILYYVPILGTRNIRCKVANIEVEAECWLILIRHLQAIGRATGYPRLIGRYGEAKQSLGDSLTPSFLISRERSLNSNHDT